MTGLGLVSAKGSPGVTTSAVLLAALWPTPSVLLEADPAGGDLRYWYSDEHGRPLRPDRGVVSLLTARGVRDEIGGSAGGGLARHAQVLPGGLPVLIGPDGPGQVVATEGLWDRLAMSIAAHDGHVVVDGGRLTNASTLAHTMPLLRGCQRTLLVCRATVSSLAHACELLNLLDTLDLPAQVLLIGGASPSTAERTDAAAAVGRRPEQVHVLPDDPVSAAAVTSQWSRRLDRSRLVRAARSVASELYPQVQLAAQRNNEQLPAQGASS
jgi:hypothetical protein